jgi:hypothetical protein
MDMWLPHPVQTVTDAFLGMVDAQVPGLIEGLYFVGSIALNDYRTHRSDIDFVALMAHRPTPDELDTLTHIHTALQQRWRRPFFDGIYVTQLDLASDPQSLAHCPSAHEGRFLPASEGDIITWHTLAQHGLRVRGPAISPLTVWVDPTRLAAWTDQNLDAYWQRHVLDRGARLLTPSGLVGQSAWSCEWCVTGVSRLHYTLATGSITSKEGAALYVHATFPARWHRVLDEALRIRRADRRRSLYRSPFARRRDVRAFTAMVIADAHRLYKQGVQ